MFDMSYLKEAQHPDEVMIKDMRKTHLKKLTRLKQLKVNLFGDSILQTLQNQMGQALKKGKKKKKKVKIEVTTQDYCGRDIPFEYISPSPIIKAEYVFVFLFSNIYCINSLLNIYI